MNNAMQDTERTETFNKYGLTTQQN